MLKVRDAFVLAWTKLLSRKLWTSLFLVMEVILLAGVLIFASAMQGFEQSLAKFNNEGLNGKYLVTAANVRNNPDLAKDSAVMDLAEELYHKGVAEHEAVAKRLGISYSAESEVKPTEYVDGKRELVMYSPYAQQAVDGIMADYLVADKSDLEKALEGYSYKQIFTEQLLVADGSIVNLENGAEDLKRYTYSLDSMQAQVFNGLYALNDELYQDYFFENIEQDNTAIPVVISVSQAETVLGIDGVGSSASNEEKIKHFEELEGKASGLVVEACYRNSASKDLIFTAQRVLDEIERNKDKPYYNEPSVIYDLPTTACGAVTVKKDSRTTEEKEQDNLRIEYQKALGDYEESVQKLLKFQIVGLVPVSNNTNQSNDILGMIESLGGVSIATPLVSEEYYNEHKAELSEVFEKSDASIDYLGMGTQYIVEFDDAETARHFIAEQSCETKGALNYGCATEEHLFLLSADSNNSLVIEDISRTFMQMLAIMIIAVLIITAIFMALMVIRSITNDRKEIAIFRAIGFRKVHILQVYLMYALILGVIIVSGAVVLSLVVGYTLNPIVSGEVTNFLRATFSTLDPTMQADIFMPSAVNYVWLSGAVIAASLVSTLLPTIIKSRQNIISGLKFE